jgi:hypothetical protein
MTQPSHSRSRLAVWYETVRGPGWVLTLLVFLLYAPSLFGGFMLDDHRCVRHLREYHEGQRASPDVYAFLWGGERNTEAREAGWYPWWITQELRYRHLRPVSEWVLYAEYVIFGERPALFRIVGLAIYALGVRIVLALLRLIVREERTARWGALVFAVASGHAIPVVFVSAHCDVIALALSGAAILLAGQYAERGGPWRVGAGVILFGASLFAKEAALPAAVLPMCFAVVMRDRRAAVRRALGMSGLYSAVGIAWLAYYASQGYGSNALLMMDPLHAPLDYLSALPGRAIVLLSSWVIPFNPFLFWFHHDWHVGAYVYGGIGVVALALIARMFLRYHRGRRDVPAAILWVVIFLPLLACTIPDDRVMVLPSIGLACLAAIWMTRPRADGSLRLRKLPVTLFIVLQVWTVLATYGIMQFMEYEAQKHLRMMVAGFERPLRSGDHIFFINNARNFEALFTQDRLNHVLGRSDVRVSLLSDIVSPSARVLDEHTLRMEADDPPLFSSFAGMMGTARGSTRHVGDTADVGEFSGTIVRTAGDEVHGVEIRFEAPITDDRYRFYWNDMRGEPQPWPNKRLSG